MTDYLITSLGGSDAALTMEVIEADGGLLPVSRLELGGGAGPLALSPDGRHLYACANVDGQHEARSYRIEADGALTLTGRTDMGASACQISTDRTGRFLLAAYYSDGMVTVDPIDAAGALGEARCQLLPTEQKAHYIATDASNRFAYVPHVGDANCIYQFRFDADTGQLTPNDPARVSPEAGQGPRHLCFHPTADYVFTDGEQGSSVTLWDLNGETGSLAPRQTLSTLPAPDSPDAFGEENTCSQIHITPDGRFIFAGNRGHHSVAGFRVGADGSLAAIGQTRADPNPRPMAISPDGRFLFAAGSTTDGRLIRWAIDETSGVLDSPVYHDCGPVYWVTTLRR